MSLLPVFITFTGVDDETDVDAMVALSAKYPIEWGILFSPKRQGDIRSPRYPAHPERFSKRGLRLAAHLCGDYARSVVERERHSPPPPLNPSDFKRVQINHRQPDSWQITKFQKLAGPRCIAQTRDASFPQFDEIDWLFDRSGGRGISPAAWPRHDGTERLLGYAGGIGPHNVASVIEAIAATGPYWIDMESGVRTKDRFSLEKCEHICKAVYGPRSLPLEECEYCEKSSVRLALCAEHYKEQMGVSHTVFDDQVTTEKS